ncbi:MAG: hypothetical protein LC798_20585 [Chloroflexi bacterium]|nr:hypothetical protein [Chloroflexota bacterium]
MAELPTGEVFGHFLADTPRLAIAGTIFGSTLLEEVPRRMRAAGVPEQMVAGFSAGGGSTLTDVSAVGDLGASILADVPEQFRAQVEPFVPAIVDGVHQAFSIATAATFGVGIITSLLAGLLVLVVLPARRMGEGPEQASSPDARLEPIASSE